MFRKKLKEESEKLKEESEKLKLEEIKKYREKLEAKAQDYVLTISAGDYINSKGNKSLDDYIFKSVSAEEKVYESALVGITQEGIKFGAEVIVDVKPSHNVFCHRSFLYLIGTALIPKRGI